MWDLRVTHPFGRLSARKVLLFAVTLVAACLMYIFASAPAAHAAAATWKDGSIVYQDNTYSAVPDVQKGDSIDLEPGTHVYLHLDDAPSSDSNKVRKAHVIYFAPGVSPPEATSADHRSYDFRSPSTFSNPGVSTSIELTPAASNPGVDSCGNDNLNGVGWIVCPLTKFFAGAMDTLFTFLTSFLEVRPVQTSTENALYRAWSYMRVFANVAFVIAFLIIIYSQVTSLGVSNYGVKKLLPRLVIAAVLVNISYWICAVAIDVSNILGYAVQDLFIYMRNHLVGTEGNEWLIVSWKDVAGVVLAGATGATALGVGGVLMFTGAGAGSIYLLLPVLLGVITAVLVALLVLAARQAIITVLVILAPLAFVAYLLPNTEKYFGKWRDLLMTMLLLFPIFSVIFGGSQLAGAAIIQNADSILTIIMGLAVQVAPIVITPLLVRFSGSLLGRIAGMINNPNKGLLDRTKKFSQDRMANYEAKRKADILRKQEFRRSQGRKPSAYSRAALYRDNKRREREGWRKANESYADAAWENTDMAHSIHDASQSAAKLQERGREQAQASFEKRVAEDSYIKTLDQDVRVAKLKADASKAKVETNWQNIAGRDPALREIRLSERLASRQGEDAKGKWENEITEWENGKQPVGYKEGSDMANMINESRLTARSIALQGMRKQQAERYGTEAIATEMQTNVEMQSVASGIMGERGQSSALANAKKTASKYTVDDIQNIKDTMNYDDAKDNKKLHELFNKAQTMAQRVAYAQAMTKNGAPGVSEFRKILHEYGDNINVNIEDRRDFKELVATDGGILGLGKDIEFFLTQSRDDNGNIRSFDSLSNDLKTWTNLSASAFSNQNASTHHHALKLLYDNDRAAYRRVIDMIRNNPQALGGIKQGVRERFSIYSDAERANNQSLPEPGVISGN